MKTCRIGTLLAISAGAAAVGAASLHASTGAEAGAAAIEHRQENTGQGTEAPQRPEELRLAEREQLDDGGQRVRVGNTQFIFNDIFDFDGSANDLFIWGWLPTISGEVSDNGFFGGQKVDIAADAYVGGDVFLFAQTGSIKGVIGGDLYAFVADLTIDAGARVDGAIHGSSGALTIDGEVGGPLSYAAGAIVINGTVRGDAKLEAGELEIGPDAVIEGTLSYESPREATIDPGAAVGAVEYFVPRETSSDEEEASAPANGWFSVWGFLWNALWLVSSFLVGAIALAVGGDAARAPAQRLGSQPALGLGFGFVVAVVFPAAAILAMILVVTIPLGLISLALYVAAAYLARLVAAQALGAWLLRVALSGREASAYGSLAAGLLVLFFLIKIPYVGFLVWMAAIVAGLGGIFLATRRAGTEAPAATAPAMTP
jgi:cytoskeletal protein CcmA (bactofilin family)